MLSDAFIATDTELDATRFECSGGSVTFFPILQGKNIDPVMLLMLENIVMKQATFDLNILDQRIVRGYGGSEEWFYQFPDIMVAKLVELNAAEISRYDARWASTDKWSGKKRSSPIAAATEYLQQLCSLAIRAQAEKKHIYIWIAL